MTPSPAGSDSIVVRRARVADVRRVKELVDCYAGPILLEKSLANLFEDVTEFWVAEVDGEVQGCGALHVLWEDLGEIRTVATNPELRGRGIGGALCRAVIAEAQRLGIARLFVLTFEKHFFGKHGFAEIDGTPVSQEVFAAMLRSYDTGVAEFLDLAHVKPNTLGNVRMLLNLQ